MCTLYTLTTNFELLATLEEALEKFSPIERAKQANCVGGQVILICQFMFIALDNDYIVLNQLLQINISHNHFSTSPSE